MAWVSEVALATVFSSLSSNSARWSACSFSYAFICSLRSLEESSDILASTFLTSSSPWARRHSSRFLSSSSCLAASSFCSSRAAALSVSRASCREEQAC